MGYTWELWSVAADVVVDELRRPSLRPGDLQVDSRDAAVTAAVSRWDELAAVVAAAAGGDGGNVTGELAVYTVLVVRTLGRFAGSVAHTSSGGAQFRDEFLGRDLAAVVGRPLALQLLVRELSGLTLLDDVMLGWADVDQCRAAAAAADALDPDTDLDEDLWRTLDALVAGAEGGTGLVTLYT